MNRAVKKTKGFFVAKNDEDSCSMAMAGFVMDHVKKDVPMLTLEADFR
jgi:hypothetical protein